MSQFTMWISPEAEEPDSVIEGASKACAEGLRRIALLDNTKGNADLLLSMVGEDLSQTNESIRVVRFRKENSWSPAPGSLLDDIADQAEWVIGAMAD